MTSCFADIERRWNAFSDRKKRGVQFALFSITLFIMTCALYARFLCGNNALIFINAGSDSWSQSVPFFLNAADRFSELDFSTWNFAQFLGAQTVQAINPEYLVSVFGKDLVGPMMLASQMAKVFFTGIFFYLFTSYWNLRYLTRFISSLGIAFCGRMISIAAWTGYTMEVVLAVALIWAFERFLHNPRKFIALPISFALMIATLGLYGTILYSFVMLVYASFRIGYGDHRLESKRDIAIFIAQLIGLYLAGICLASITLFPIMEGYADSARVAANAEGVALPQTTSIEVYAAEILSLFTPAAFGSMADYAGPSNTLNSPYFYCGTALLLAAPFAFKGKNRRQRIWLGVFAGIALAYILSASFRFILNGFGVGSDDFRMSSFWITIALAIFGMLGFDALLKQVKPKPVIGTCIVLFALLCGACLVLHDYVRKPWVALSVICIVAYSATLIIGQRKQAIKIGAGILLIVICACDLMGQSWVMANNVSSVTKDDYNIEYNETFPTLIDQIDGEDDDLYRIDWKTALLARSMAYNYRGTLAYIGGTGISKAQTEFMKNVCANDYIEQLGYSRYAYGFNDNAVNTLLGVRYLVYDLRGRSGDENYLAPFGYHEVEHDDNGFRIYENDNALPFFMSYGEDETMSSSQLLALERVDRGGAMLKRCVVPDDQSHSPEPAKGIFPHDAAPIIASASKDSLETETTRVDFEESNEPYLVLDIELDGKSSESIYANLTITLGNEAAGESLTIPYFAATGNEHVILPVENKGYTNAEIEFPENQNPLCDISVSAFKVREASESYFEEYEATCQDKLVESPQMTTATNDRVSGSLNVAEDGYIVTSIPWSESWRASIDGVDVETFPVNYGFVGMKATAGHHDVELTYRDTPREIGTVLSLATLLALVAIRMGTSIITRRRTNTQRCQP